MQSSWPDGVTSYEDMCSYAKTLFSEQCAIEDLLTDVPDFGKRDGCFLIRVKGACRLKKWDAWPVLIDRAMSQTVGIHGSVDVIQVKARAGGPKQRLYETLQVSPPTCSCRVYFGGDKHMKFETSSSATEATNNMAKMLMVNFEPRRVQWNQENQCGYYKKAFHLVLNRYQWDDGLDPHKDRSETYDPKNPIASPSYGRGSILMITDSNKKRRQKNSPVLPIPW